MRDWKSVWVHFKMISFLTQKITTNNMSPIVVSSVYRQIVASTIDGHRWAAPQMSGTDSECCPPIR